MARILKNDPEIEKAQRIAWEMLDSGFNMNQVRVRVNKECPELDRGTKRWTLLEIERERGNLSGAVQSPQEAADTPGAGAEAERVEGGKKRGVRVRRRRAD